MKKMKTLRLAASVSATVLLAGVAQGQDYNVLARELYEQGFEDRATIRVRGDELHVEVTGTAGRTERVYSRDGATLLEEETVTSDGSKVEREYGNAGRVVEEEIVLADGVTIEREYDAAGNVIEEEVEAEDRSGAEKRSARAELRGDNRSERGAERSAAGRDRDEDDGHEHDDRDEQDDRDEDEDDGRDGDRGDRGRGRG